MLTANGVSCYAARVAARTLNEIESKALLAAAGVPVTPTMLAASADDAATVAYRLGYPVALKIVSPDIVHKSDIGGVRLGLDDARAVRAAFDAIVAAARAARPEARIDGVAVQPMAPPDGLELVVGASLDPQFGQVVMCGLGGIWVEVLQDVSFRLAPLTARDARQMWTDLTGAAVLRGVRGAPAVALPALEALLLRVSALVTARPDIRELDLNPVLAYPDGVVAVDARVLLEVDP